MESTAQRYKWNPLIPDGSVQWLTYSFGPGTANALAVKLMDGSFAVVSPPTGAPAEVFDTLERQGGVCVLIAPNKFHNLGQPEWRKRFPQALSCAPRGSHEHLVKRAPDIDYLALEDCAARLLPMHIVLPAGMKSPDVVLRIPSTAGHIWWMGDLFSNSGPSDQAWWLRMLSRLAGSGLGYRANAKPEFVYVKNRANWLKSICSALEEFPPAIVVPAHGAPVREDTAARTRKAIAAIDTRPAVSNK